MIYLNIETLIGENFGMNFKDRSINIDCTFRCTLECPKCLRQSIRSLGFKIPGVDMPLDDFYKITKYFKPGERGIPEVELHNTIQARLSGIENMVGEENPHGEYDWDNNKIYLYLPRMISVEQIIRSLIHEYIHSTQDIEQMEKNRELGYDNDPFEREAHKEEDQWEKFV